MTRSTIRRTVCFLGAFVLVSMLAGTTPDPLDGLIRTEQADRVRAAIAELPGEARELLALHYGQDLRLRDVGALMGLSEAAVKQRLSRLRRELRVRLRNEEETCLPPRRKGVELRKGVGHAGP